MVSRVCFSETLQSVNLLFQYDNLKSNQVFQACRKHYILISSNLGIKKILTGHYTWLSGNSSQSKTLSNNFFIAASVEFNTKLSYTK